MDKYSKIFQSTLAKVVITVLAISLFMSGFIFFDAYKRQAFRIKSYYWVYKGDKALKKEDLQNAIYYYEKAVKLYPGHYRALYNLANIYVVYEDYYSAIKNYEKALLVKPDFEIARIDYALILSEVYRVDDAINEYKKVLEYKPRFIKIPFLVDNKKTYEHNRGVALYNMGLAYRTKSLLAGLDDKQSRKCLQEAAKSYEKATDILKSYNSNYNLALIYQLLKESNQSAYYYCKAIELEPMEYEAHFNYAVLLNDLKDYAGAQEEFKKAGLLLDSKGDAPKTKYIYGLLNEVNAKTVIHGQKPAELPSETFKYKNGKLVTEAITNKKGDVELYKSFSICANKGKYVGGGK